MATPESKVKKKVKALLEPYELSGDMYVNWPVPAGYGAPMLDAVGCFRGKFFMIETKAPGEKMTPRQELTKEEVIAAGGRVFTIGFGFQIENNPDTWIDQGLMDLEEWLKQS